MIFANILAFVCSLLMVYISAIKNKKTAVILTVVQIIGMSICSMIAGSWSNVAVSIIGIIRNLLSYKDKMNKKYMMLIIISTIVFGIVFNTKSFVGLMPIIANLLYLYSLEGTSIFKFKYIGIAVNICWLIHDSAIGLYTAVIFDIMAIIAMICSILSLKKEQKKVNLKSGTI